MRTITVATTLLCLFAAFVAAWSKEGEIDTWDNASGAPANSSRV